MRKFTTLLFLFVALHGFGQQYGSPLNIPLELSANCGELRGNHFHSGIDIKTQRVINKPAFSVEDGYVSRIAVSPTGYGLALYIDHPKTGHTSVYGHLNSFNKEIQTYVKEQQYRQERFKVNLFPPADLFPVKRGDLVAYSGNTGGSGGPHVHFEIRDTKTEHVLDPLSFYKNRIKDTRSPEVRGVAVYPVPGRGVVNGSDTPIRQTVSLLKNGFYSDPKTQIAAWGMIGLGLKAYDRMDGVSNIYGVKSTAVLVDGKMIFHYKMGAFSFGQTRMINTFTDFADWRLHHSFYMKLFLEPGNNLPFFSEVKNSGYVTIDEERPYNITYILEDVYDNKTVYKFIIEGKKQKISIPSGCSQVFAWNHDNHYVSDAFSLIIPKKNLYNDVCFKLSQQASNEYYSNILSINDLPVPLDKSAEVSVKMTSDPLSNKKQYGLVRLKDGKRSWIGGVYDKGFIKAGIRELGMDVAVWADTEAPKVVPVLVKKAKGTIKIRVRDDLSGVASYRGTVDGKYALFEHDMKSTLYTYEIDGERIGTGKNHTLEFSAIDACGNESVYQSEFFY